MLARNWMHNLALGGCLAALLAFPVALGSDTVDDQGHVVESPAVEQSQDDDATASQSQTEPQTTEPAASPPDAGDRENPAAEDQTATQQTAEHARQDLLAQQSMAESTERLVRLTQWQISIGAAEAALLVFTVCLTAWAAYAASKAAQAAEQAIGTERAWITQSKFTFATITNGKVFGSDETIKNGLGVAIIWENTGRSPALSVGAFTDHRLVGVSAANIPTFEFTDQIFKDTGIIGPGQTMSTDLRALNDAESQAFRDKRKRLYVYSCVAYRDTFHQTAKRSSEVCFEVEYNGDRVDDDGVTRPNVSLKPVGPQNTAS